MSHPAKKIKIASEDHGEAKGAPMVPALAEEHEEPAEQLEEHAEQQEADDALEEGFKEELDNAVAALEEIQEKIRGVKEEAIDKILAIEQAANRDCKPIYSQRAELISKIPSFWKFVLLQHWFLEPIMTDEDQEVLDYLEQVIVDENPDVKSGFTVKMQFAENPFFSNRVLEKKVDYHEDGTVKLSVVPPQWFPGKDLTKIEEPVSDEADEGTRMVPSFFGWFMPPDDDRAGDDELAEIIREHIWPNPLQLYMGEAGQPPVPELGLEYADDQDGLVEYMNDSYDQDLLDEEGLEGEGYPEELEGADYGEWQQDAEGEELQGVPAGEGFQDEDAGDAYGGEDYNDAGEDAEAAVQDAAEASHDVVKEEAAGTKEEATPAAPAS